MKAYAWGLVVCQSQQVDVVVMSWTMDSRLGFGFLLVLKRGLGCHELNSDATKARAWSLVVCQLTKSRVGCHKLDDGAMEACTRGSVVCRSIKPELAVMSWTVV